jgi:hypothetical protein
VEFITRQSAAGLPAAETLRRLNHAILAHQDGALQDDATTVMVEWLTNQPDAAPPNPHQPRPAPPNHPRPPLTHTHEASTRQDRHMRSGPVGRGRGWTCSQVVVSLIPSCVGVSLTVVVEQEPFTVTTISPGTIRLVC